MERYDDEQPRAAEFLQVPSRNIGRWLPRIGERAADRLGCEMWRDAARLVRDWVRALPAAGQDSPVEQLERLLLAHLERLGDELPARARATLLGVSVPTYQKRVRYHADQVAEVREPVDVEP